MRRRARRGARTGRALALTTHATEERAIPSRPDLAVRVLVGLREVKWDHQDLGVAV
ncbi:hypothetical protein B0H11DRAFT_2232742 [Mycena galericulata]|nr:hypothetical protein B0H11DRAFT_2250427 [Mycena galericulata]KAJ7473869.1 hypothetical protein B0H11DRAFT_2236352 [Mycena galericulata]KAJ7482138.1 hypothetical protein B0H11DRAFT_2232742 [Mycena galericulata]